MSTNQEYLIQHWSELTDEERRKLLDAAKDAGEFEPANTTPPMEAPLTSWDTCWDWGVGKH